jgi:hypothetical protein
MVYVFICKWQNSPNKETSASFIAQGLGGSVGTSTVKRSIKKLIKLQIIQKKYNPKSRTSIYIITDISELLETEIGSGEYEDGTSEALSDESGKHPYMGQGDTLTSVGETHNKERRKEIKKGIEKEIEINDGTNKNGISSSSNKSLGATGNTKTNENVSDRLNNNSATEQLKKAQLLEDLAEEEIKERAKKELGFLYQTKTELRESLSGYGLTPDFKDREQIDEFIKIKEEVYRKHKIY